MLAHLSFGLPMIRRDCVIHAYAVDATEEGCLLIVGKSINEYIGRGGGWGSGGGKGGGGKGTERRGRGREEGPGETNCVQDPYW
jgi:hypothetical protein